jgi:hypothetical protein
MSDEPLPFTISYEMSLCNDNLNNHNPRVIMMELTQVEVNEVAIDSPETTIWFFAHNLQLFFVCNLQGQCTGWYLSHHVPNTHLLTLHDFNSLN